MTDNMKIWDNVSKTDPNHTKQVSFGRKFTAIDAHYQVMQATKEFGPIGEGWGYEASTPIFTPDDVIIIPVKLWHGNRDNWFGPQYGSAQLKTKKNGDVKIDTDAPKKAETDALTKLLSHLGFSADVFLGKFDDNKYVQQMHKEHKPKPKKLDGPHKSKTALQTAIKAVVHELNGCGDYDQLIAFLNINETKETIAQCEKDAPDWFFGWDEQPDNFEPLQDMIARLKKEFSEQQQKDAV